MKFTHVVLALALSGLPAAAQEVHHDCPQMTGSNHASHAAMNKSGFSDEQRSQYLNGEGMWLAKAAELNHYPGPRHVLDIADKLGLSPDQLAATRADSKFVVRCCQAPRSLYDHPRLSPAATPAAVHRADAGGCARPTGPPPRCN